MKGVSGFPESQPVLIMAGGTGGHVFPALAVAEEILSRNIPVVWLGTHHGIEARLVPEAGIPIEWVSVSGLRGKRFTRLLTAPFMLALAAWQCLRILLRLKPKLVLGMGGFVTGPGGVMARLLGRPLFIHEQNAIAGMTNRYLSHIASKVMEAFPDSFPAKTEATVTGNPVREGIVNIPEPEKRISEHKGPLRLLVLGGSLGAQALNQVVPEALARFPSEKRPVVKHQAGRHKLDEARVLYEQAGLKEGVEVLPFIDDMAQAYAWADLVLCRAGALTVSELAAAGVGAILVPYPYAVDDHQSRNADFLTAAGAALVIIQHELDANKLHEVLQGFDDSREKLMVMARAARSLATKNAARQVADICLQAGVG